MKYKHPFLNEIYDEIPQLIKGGYKAEHLIKIDEPSKAKKAKAFDENEGNELNKNE